MSKNSHSVAEMRKVKANCETDSYHNSRFNAVKHGGHSTAFLSLSKEERNQIIYRLNRGEKRLHGVDFKIPPIDKGAGENLYSIPNSEPPD